MSHLINIYAVCKFSYLGTYKEFIKDMLKWVNFLVKFIHSDILSFPYQGGTVQMGKFILERIYHSMTIAYDA